VDESEDEKEAEEVAAEIILITSPKGKYNDDMKRSRKSHGGSHSKHNSQRKHEK